jgi:hypothetical protein
MLKKITVRANTQEIEALQNLAMLELRDLSSKVVIIIPQELERRGLMRITPTGKSRQINQLFIKTDLFQPMTNHSVLKTLRVTSRIMVCLLIAIFQALIALLYKSALDWITLLWKNTPPSYITWIFIHPLWAIGVLAVTAAGLILLSDWVRKKL